jgi:HSP20 family protein
MMNIHSYYTAVDELWIRGDLAMIGPVAQFSFIPSGESKELANDIKEMLDDLARTLPREQRAYSGECRPTLDVLETDAAVEVTVDLSGVPNEAIRVLFRGGVLIIAGEKAPSAGTPEQTYHLVERDFGRFARVVRLTGAFDVLQARATLRDGELTIVLPRRDDRRDQAHHVQVVDGG